MLAIRISGIGVYMGPQLETDGVNRPREAWRSLMSIAGFKASAGSGPQVTFAVPGHVLRDVSLDISQGSVVCLTPSGDESNMLLRVLAGATAPTAGRAEMYGPVTSLLAPGDNLDPRLTAYENIVALPALAGAPADAVAARVREVLDFAELHDFEHVSIRTFSTGMVLRLSVALALCGRPSIVLIDDVLAVGDIGFQQRCIDRLRELKDEGCTMVLAFGDEQLVDQLATRVITFAGGKVIADSAPGDAVQPSVSRAPGIEWQLLGTLPENDVIALRSLDLAAGDGEHSYLDVRATFTAKTAGLRCRPLVEVASARTALFRSVYPEFVVAPEAGPMTFSVRVPTDVLPEGTYVLALHVVAVDGNGVYALKALDAATFTLKRDAPAPAEDAPVPQLLLALPWEVERVAEAV